MCENKYSPIINQMPAGYALHEILCNEEGKPVDYKFLEINPAFERITGLKAESLIGHTCLEILPKTESSWIERYGKVALTGESITFEDFSQEINRSLEVTAFRTAPKQFACIFNDITERKKTEMELITAKEKAEKSEYKTKAILNTIPDLVFVVDNAGVFTYYQADFKDLFYTNNSIIGKNYSDLLPTDVVEIIGSHLKLALESGSIETFEYNLEIPNVGKKEYEARMLKSGKNEVTTIVRDITERKQAELALASEKERLAVTLRSIGDGVITTDINGNIVMLNKVAEALTGWNSKDAEGHPLPDVFNIINENTRKKCENPVEMVLSTGGIIELENHTCLIAKDGREIVIADSGAPIHDKNSKIIGVVLVFRDMTEKHKLEDFLQKSQKLESLGVLAGGIAHDFNNILSAVFGFLELALVKTSESEVSDYLNSSLSSIDRARALTQQLLTFAKGGVPIKKIQPLFPFVQETVQFALSGSSVSSKFQIQNDLWTCDLDKNQISQVIDNLIINAQQAMPDGGTIEIFARNISLSEKELPHLVFGNYVKLTIKDHGVGIPKEFLPKIFDPYYTTKTNGHGLGLATCYSIINRHGGSINAESESGKGSTFHLYLPASIDAVSTAEISPVEKHKGCGTFLVMDDETVLLDLMKNILESFGYDVVLKTNTKDAIDFFTAEFNAGRRIAGIIFDLTIPGGMGGKEAVEEIRKICSDTPVFVASGYSGDPVMANPDKYGFNASICKPFMMHDLSEMLKKHIKPIAP